jgi:hypothetical protein
MTYEIIPAKLWRHANGVLTASIYGACPWTSEAGKADWTLTNEGCTVRNTRTGTVGSGRKPFPTIEAVQEWLDTFPK